MMIVRGFSRRGPACGSLFGSGVFRCEGLADLGYTGIREPRDVRLLQPGEKASLPGKTQLTGAAYTLAGQGTGWRQRPEWPGFQKTLCIELGIQLQEATQLTRGISAKAQADVPVPGRVCYRRVRLGLPLSKRSFPPSRVQRRR